MKKLIIVSALFVTAMLGFVAVNVQAQTASLSPSSSPMATSTPGGAPQTGFGRK